MFKKFKHLALSGAIMLTPLLAAGAASAATTDYYVKPGDTLYKIAYSHGVSLTSLEQANPQVANFNIIWPGMTIHLSSQQAPAPTQTASGISQYAQQVANLVNQERAKAGLKPLSLNTELSVMAKDKAIDMYDYHYFDHTSPHYGSPFDMMSKYGISYSYAGENIAMGQQSPQQVMNDWMNSPGHRANILNSHYTSIGVAYYNGEWVQEFIG